MNMDSIFTITSPLTAQLALIVGGYLSLSSAGNLRSDQGRQFYADVLAHPGAMHAAGAIATFVALTLLAFNADHSSLAGLFVTGISVFWLIEGAGLLFSPQQVSTAMASPRFAATRRALDCLLLLVGLYLLGVFTLN